MNVPEWLSRALDNAATKLDVNPRPVATPPARNAAAPTSLGHVLPPSFNYAGAVPFGGKDKFTTDQLGDAAGTQAFADLPDTQREQWANIHANQGYQGTPDQSFANTFTQYMANADRMKQEQPQIYNYLRSVVGVEYGRTPEGNIQPNDAIAGSIPLGDSSFKDNGGYVSGAGPTAQPTPRDFRGSLNSAYRYDDPRKFTGKPGAPVYGGDK